nr:hypothetical protein Iba_chr03bCG18530 [Ipomoea batatas]
MVKSFRASVLISVILFCIAKAKPGGNAQANIMIMPNCSTNSRKSANRPSSSSSTILAE